MFWRCPREGGRKCRFSQEVECCCHQTRGHCKDRLLQMGSNEMAVVCLPLFSLRAVCFAGMQIRERAAAFFSGGYYRRRCVLLSCVCVKHRGAQSFFYLQFQSGSIFCIPGEAALIFAQFHHTILCVYRHKSQALTWMWMERESERERGAPVISHESESASVVDPEPGVLRALAAYCNY